MIQLPKNRSQCPSKCPNMSETSPMGWQMRCKTHHTPCPSVPFQSGSRLPQGDTLQYRKRSQTPKGEALKT